MGLRTRLSDLARRVRRARRRAWAGPERAWIELRAGPDAPELPAAVVAALEAIPGVRWARPNAVLGRVVVACDAPGPDLDTLVAAVEAAEAGVRGAAFATDPRGLPVDGATDLRLTVESIADVVALAVGLLGRGGDDAATATELDVAAFLRVIEEVPWIRRVLDDWLGTASADLVLGLADAASAASLRGVTGPATDLVYRRLRLRARRAARAAWLAREAELGGTPDAHPDRAEPAGERPVPLPDGPVERYAGGAVLAALGGFGIGVANTHRFERAAGALLGGVPKPAHLGRKAFTAAVAERLAGEGFVVLDERALRRLDRLDTVVVDGAWLAPVSGEVVDVRPVAEGADAAVRRRVLELFDTRDPFAVRHDDGWILGPLSALHLVVDPRLAGPLRAAAAPGGRLLGLVHHDVLLAVVAVRPELDPAAETLLAALRAEGLRLVVAADVPERVAWLGAERIVPTGRGRVAAVRELQAAGRGVCVVGTGDDPALAHADLAVGLPARGVATPWHAHVVAPADLGAVAWVATAIGAARRAAHQSVQIATIEAIGALALSLEATSARTTRRVLAVSNLATALALANGVRVARSMAAPPRVDRRDHTPWHALSEAVVLERVGARADGLPEAEAARRRVPPPPPPGELQALQAVLADELDNPLAPVLATGAALSALTGSTTDALMVGGVLGINGLIGATQRVRAERALRELDRQEARTVRVLRDGAWRAVPADAVVRGDRVRLEAGEIVPGDARVLAAHAVEVDESVLTGESVPVVKGPAPSFAPNVADRASMLFAGTTIAAGEVEAVVVAVGDTTEARSAAARVPHRVPRGVEARLEALTRFTAPVAALAGLAVLVSGLARRTPTGELVGSAVSLSVAAVPEGLPLLAMLSQLATARRLAARGALARNPRALEALGRVDVVCADKTGTLTEGRLRLALVHDGRVEAPAADPGALVGLVQLAARATPVPAGGPLPHPTDEAIAEGARALGADDTAPRRAELPFEPKRGWHATLGDDGRLVVKGSPEALLPACTHARAGSRRRRLTDAERARLEALAHALGARGLRVLALAERVHDGDTLAPADVDQLTFRGFVALADPVRPSGRRAVDALRRAGVRVLMATGDHPATAAAIGRELGLGVGRVLTGAELDRLDDAGLDAALAGIDVLARVTPQHKVRVVQALQRQGRVVAMTGDGANDAPAIRQADVGIALGDRATTAARHAAALVVADGRIETIVEALLEGRALWASVRDAVGMLVGSNLGEIAYMLVGGVATGRAPLNARQLLLVNLLTDALPALALAVRPPQTDDPEALSQAGPEASLGAALERDLVWRAAVTSVTAGAAWTAARWTLGPKQADTVGLVSLVGTQLGQTMLLGRGSPDVRRAAVGSLAALLGVVQTPGVSRFFGSRPLGPVGLVQAATAIGAGTVAAAVLPPVVERLATWVEGHVDRDALARSELARALGESRTLRRLADRGARLRAAAGRGEDAEE